MRLPEVRIELLPKANPMNFDLYKSAFGDGGELEAYATLIRKKLIMLHDTQKMAAQRLEV